MGGREDPRVFFESAACDSCGIPCGESWPLLGCLYFNPCMEHAERRFWARRPVARLQLDGRAFWGRHAERNLSSDLPAALPCERAVDWLGCRTRLHADEPQLRRVCTIVVFDSICSMRPDPRHGD